MYKVFDDPQGQIALTVMNSYLDGLLQATDSTFYSAGPETAEAGVERTVYSYRQGRFLREQQDYFNAHYLNRRYKEPYDRREFYPDLWQPTDAFCATYITTDSLYFTRTLSTVFSEDSHYKTQYEYVD